MVKWRSLVIGGAVSAVCLYLLLRQVDPTRTWAAFARADPAWLASARFGATHRAQRIGVALRCGAE